MSENAIGYLLNRAGYHGRHVPHGFRAAFSTIMNEWAERQGKKHDRKIIDLMLAHIPKERSEEHTSELQSLMRISYAVFCLKKKKINNKQQTNRLLQIL